MIPEDSIIIVGKTFKPHSYKGALKVSIDFDPDILEEDKSHVFIKLDNIPVPFVVEEIGGGQDGASYLKLKGIDSDEAASELANKDIYMLKKDVAESLGMTEGNLEDLEMGYEGFIVTDSETGTPIGEVVGIEEGVEYDYLTVKTGSTNEELQIPIVDEYINDIKEASDGKRGEIIVTLPEGFLGINN